MIDPRDIPRPAMFPMARPCRMTSKEEGLRTAAHTHRAYPDAVGNGATDVVASHFHYIQGGAIEASAVDGHTHLLLHVLCGTGR
jgi:hypothetical protein